MKTNITIQLTKALSEHYLRRELFEKGEKRETAQEGLTIVYRNFSHRGPQELIEVLVKRLPASLPAECRLVPIYKGLFINSLTSQLGATLEGLLSAGDIDILILRKS